jgi:hypothetical protein
MLLAYIYRFAYIYRSITHRVHFLDKASRDLSICAKDSFIEGNGGPHTWASSAFKAVQLV